MAGGAWCASLVRLNSIRLSTTSRTVCGADGPLRCTTPALVATVLVHTAPAPAPAALVYTAPVPAVLVHTAPAPVALVHTAPDMLAAVAPAPAGLGAGLDDDVVVGGIPIDEGGKLCESKHTNVITLLLLL